jgi:hypothetical protein
MLLCSSKGERSWYCTVNFLHSCRVMCWKYTVDWTSVFVNKDIGYCKKDSSFHEVSIREIDMTSTFICVFSAWVLSDENSNVIVLGPSSDYRHMFTNRRSYSVSQKLKFIAYLQYHWLSREKFSDGRKNNVGNISILSMTIVPSQEVAYYHKLERC